MQQRVQKILREWGIASRREAEKMILAGRIKINDRPIKLGERADSQEDIIKIDDKILTNRPDLSYILVHKPKGVVSTCHDPQNRQTVIDLLAPELRCNQGIHPVGRLDRDSTGALLLTNDGQLTLNLTHPRYHLKKTYQVWVKGNPSESILDKWREGIMLEDKKTLPAQVEILTQKPTKTLLKIVINEGRNRQIRKVGDLLGFPVLNLHRIAIGSIRLSSLPCGQYRFLQDWEIKKLTKK
jgi:pseudouridine synthase